MQKYVVQWQRNVRGHDLLGKYVKLWKRWKDERKAVEKSAAFILRRLRFGEKAWAFDKLRNLKKAALRTFVHTARTELIRR